jgi:hypothetical protein
MNAAGEIEHFVHINSFPMFPIPMGAIKFAPPGWIASSLRSSQ